MAFKRHIYHVYILTTSKNTVLYTGVSGQLPERCQQHKDKLIDGFTKRYNVDKLVYYEVFRYVQEAIKREKQIKGYKRFKKVALIEGVNPDWEELFVGGVVKELPC